MKGVVQSLYKDAISALKAEGKIVELRNARRSPLFVHRDAIIDQLRVESGGDRERRPASPTHSFEAASISLDYIRPYYLALKAEQGGISTVKIYDILKNLTSPRTSFMPSCCAKLGTDCEPTPRPPSIFRAR